MARNIVETNHRLQIRLSAAKKARIARAAAIRQVDLTQFVTESALREADAVIEREERITVSERDFIRILELLENPPEPNEKLKAAFAALPDDLCLCRRGMRNRLASHTAEVNSTVVTTK